MEAEQFNMRRADFLKSLNFLIKQSEKDSIDDENIAATLHFYEMTFELSWKLIKDYLEIQGFLVKSPREAINKAFQMGYINDDVLWLEMLDVRNNIILTYEERTARILFSKIKYPLKISFCFWCRVVRA